MAGQDTLTRQIYGRIFSGAHESIAYTTPSMLQGAIFDKTYMPALLIERGKQAFYEFQIPQSGSYTVPLPEDYDTDNRLYIAVRTDLNATITYTSPTHGAGKKVLLKATDSDDDGTHAAFWTFQGDMTTFAVSIPSTANGGATTCVQVFMYEIPTLTDFESFFDKQIGLGVSGDD